MLPRAFKDRYLPQIINSFRTITQPFQNLRQGRRRLHLRGRAPSHHAESGGEDEREGAGRDGLGGGQGQGRAHQLSGSGKMILVAKSIFKLDLQ